MGIYNVDVCYAVVSIPLRKGTTHTKKVRRISGLN